MFTRLGSLVVRLRWPITLVWLGAAAVSLLAPPLSIVGSADETTFLPQEVESVAAREALVDGFPAEAGAATATIVLARDGGLTEADRAYLSDLGTWLAGPTAPEAIRRVVRSVVTPSTNPELEAMLASADGTTIIGTVYLNVAPYQSTANDAVDAMRERLRETAPAGLQAHVTGQAGIGADYLRAIVDGTDRTTVATILLVVLVLLAIYRAPLAALVPLATIGGAFLVARGVLSVLAQAGWQVPSLVDSFVVVLVFGVGTDYTIFLISRYREELREADIPTATRRSVGRVGAVVAASAATVVVGLSAMTVAHFGLIQTVGPALAIAIVVTLLAGLTLAPALLVLFGRRLFWPRHPERRAPGESASREEHGLWARIARLVTDRPVAVTAVVLGAFLVPLVLLPGMRTSFDVLTELPAASDSRAGFEQVARAFERGQLLPISVVVRAPKGADLSSPAGLAALRALDGQLAAVPGVARVRSVVAPTGDGTVPDALRPSVQLGKIASGLGQLATPAAVRLALAQPGVAAQLEASGDYLKGLIAAYPDLLGPLGPGAPIVADLATLGTLFDEVRAAQPGGVSNATVAAIAEVAGRLSTSLAGAAQALASRPDDLFLPASSGAVDDPIGRLRAAYLGRDAETARVTVITADDPYATGALETVGRIRELVGPSISAAGPVELLVGGTTAEFRDVKDTIEADFTRVALITIAGILVVLALLLRSIVAPLFLVGTVLLSYGASMNIAAWFFQDVLGQQGTSYFLPLIVFVLLVALGSDYNIFIASRIREESTGRQLKDGIRIASARTGTVITSAGIILAGTFGSLMTAPLQILFQVGAAVAIGVLLDTFVVRSILVPAIFAVVGRWSWWPSGWHRRGGQSGRRREAVIAPS